MVSTTQTTRSKALSISILAVDIPVCGEKLRGLGGTRVRRWTSIFSSSSFTDHTELCWQITASLSISQGDLSDWRSGDFKQLGVFVRNEREKST